ncbi:MAG: hypothetical protein P8Q46_05040 [Candidatus Thalassarchaeaceae archaeon]|nr:hypothetical protein [Candidatus Thalassarchaeaceae archaeon]
MTERRRQWARITTASSAILLLVAVISLWQVSPELLESYDPEANSLVKLGPGESVTFDIEESEMVTALRLSHGETPDSELTLLDDEGSEVTGRERGRMDPNRLGSDEKTVYSPVRIFENLGGSYTLQNHGDTHLWLVDDEESADKLLGNFWMYLLYIGCCIGSPVGLVGVILAIMVWTDKRKMPDQFVIINNGSVIMDDVQSEGSDVERSEVAPGPFWEEDVGASEDPQDDVIDETWKRWDEG